MSESPPKNAAAPSAVDAMIVDLAGDGVTESAGEFTLDRETAREKMRQFQLHDPTRYVLEWVQAAVLKGATRIRVTTDSDDLRMEFDGRPFGRGDFDDIYGSVFRNVEGDDGEALRSLALGINAAMRLDAVFVRVLSGDGDGGAELVVDARKGDSFGEAEGACRGTSIHFRSGLSARALLSERPEVGHLREACRFASATIEVNGERLNESLQSVGVVGSMSVVGDGFRGWIGFRPPLDDPPDIHLLRGGVLIERLSFPLFSVGLVGLVDAPRARLDLSRTAVVRDELYEEVRLRVTEAVELAFGELCRLVTESAGEAGVTGWVERSALRRALVYYGQQPRGAEEAPSPLLEKLSRAAIWASSGGLLSLQDIAGRLGRDGKLHYVRGKLAAYGGEPARRAVLGNLPCLQLDSEDLPLFERRFGAALVDVGERLRGTVDRDRQQRARQDWEQQAQNAKEQLVDSPEVGFMALHGWKLLVGALLGLAFFTVVLLSGCG